MVQKTQSGRARANKSRSKIHEKRTLVTLQRWGVHRCILIPDTWIKGKHLGGKTFVCTIGGQELDGDIAGRLPGVSDICECKMTDGETLPYSAFTKTNKGKKRNQHQDLTEMADLGVMILISWQCHAVQGSPICIFPYYPDEWKPGKGIKWDQAVGDIIRSREELEMHRLDVLRYIKEGEA